MKRSRSFLVLLFATVGLGCGGDGDSSTNKGGFSGLGMAKPAGTGTPTMMGGGGGLGGVATPGGTTNPGGTTTPGAGGELSETIWHMQGQTQGCYSYVYFKASDYVAGDACPLQDGTVGVESFGGTYTRTGGNLNMSISLTSCPAKIGAGTLAGTYAVSGNNLSIKLPDAMLSMTKGEPPVTGTLVFGCFDAQGGFVPANATGN